MPKPALSLPAVEADPILVERMQAANRVCLSAATLIGLLNLFAWLIPGLACSIPPGRHLMKADSALAALLCAMGLWLPGRRNAPWLRRLAPACAAAAALMAAAILLRHWLNSPVDLAALLPVRCDGQVESMTSQAAVRYFVLGLAVILTRSRKRLAHYAADLLVFCLCFLVVISASEYIFGTVRIFGLGAPTPASLETVICMALLMLACAFSRAEDSVLSIFLGQGIGGRIARVLAPFVLLVPIAREALRAHLIQAQLVPAHSTAILASTTIMAAGVLMVILAWYIHSMESEIRTLSLRDPLTGLYNSRGFSLLAEQALRLARRSQLPFSVLYIDLDNLKQVNDAHGHAMGSAFLAETGQLLKMTFRESDVMARIGGDEFVVAGYFSAAAVAIAAQRLETACAAKNASSAAPAPLSLSIGYVTAAENSNEMLNDLLAAADKAMYEEKRRRKVPTA
ncbi:MAG TPA: GGDEF domain-containing protein [Terracidiphilus sp.]|nr:GGDEF domain-containing protein [Terracidiphilus sp.]